MVRADDVERTEVSKELRPYLTMKLADSLPALPSIGSTVNEAVRVGGTRPEVRVRSDIHIRRKSNYGGTAVELLCRSGAVVDNHPGHFATAGCRQFLTSPFGSHRLDDPRVITLGHPEASGVGEVIENMVRRTPLDSAPDSRIIPTPIDLHDCVIVGADGIPRHNEQPGFYVEISPAQIHEEKGEILTVSRSPIHSLLGCLPVVPLMRGCIRLIANVLSHPVENFLRGGEFFRQPQISLILVSE